MGDPTFLGTFPWVGDEGCLCVCLLGTQDSTFLCPVSQFCLGTLLLASWARDLCSYIGPTFGFVLYCHLEVDFWTKGSTPSFCKLCSQSCPTQEPFLSHPTMTHSRLCPGSSILPKFHPHKDVGGGDLNWRFGTKENVDLSATLTPQSAVFTLASRSSVGSKVEEGRLMNQDWPKVGNCWSWMMGMGVVTVFSLLSVW